MRIIMKKSKRNIILLLILFVFSLINPINSAFNQGEKAQSIVPISNLSLENHLFLSNFIVPNILAPILIVLFPSIFVPLFLGIKNKIWRNYENTYVNISEESFNMKKLVKRLIYLFLLTMGMSAALLNSGVISVTDFLTIDQAGYWLVEKGIDSPLYITDIFLNIGYLVFPIAVGLWSIGWALEDCGLMHYNLPRENQKILYEIEPIFRKYTSMVKGYAGISAIIYFLSILLYYLINKPEDLLSIIGVIIFSLLIAITVIPSYFIYNKFINSFLRKRLTKGMKEIRMITIDELKQQ